MFLKNNPKFVNMEFYQCELLGDAWAWRHSCNYLQATSNNGFAADNLAYYVVMYVLDYFVYMEPKEMDTE